MTTGTWLSDWWQGWVNTFDGFLLNHVYRRRGVSFIYYFTNPVEWEEYMGTVCERPHVDEQYQPD